MFRYDRTITSLGLSRICATVFAILISLSTAQLYRQAHAQRRDPVAGPGSSEARRGALRTLDIDPPTRSNELRIPFALIKEDLDKLEAINVQLSERTRAASALDYAQVKRDSAEIERRAERLRKNLLLPEHEKREDFKEGKNFPPGDLLAAVEALDGAVRRFVQNPVVQEPNIAEAKLLAQASDDCERVIELSERIKKIAKLLLKKK